MLNVFQIRAETPQLTGHDLEEQNSINMVIYAIFKLTHNSVHSWRSVNKFSFI